ncbi:flagellar assembly protein T N-terminal domain-containing protein [Pseudaeromonas paramecii]|uniref:Flagellar assembly protein T middle domain-containing protein n=1 Tax=Pseudaeromonas paramecii TaxID=2138166 RepID=A0ABP8QHX8_9GAMM
MQKYLFPLIWLLVLLGMFAMSHSAKAAWYSGTGSAPIVDDNLEMARYFAARAAIHDAVAKSGYSLSVMDQVTPDTLKFQPGSKFRFLNDKMTLIGQLPPALSQLELIEEISRDERLDVTLRVNLWPGAPVCPRQPFYSKSLTLARLVLRDPAQASLGQLYNLSEAVTDRLYRLAQAAQGDFIVRGLQTEPLAIGFDGIDADDQQELTSLAYRTNSQYLLDGEITDISTSKQENLLSSDQLVRQFELTLRLMDGLTGQPISIRHYDFRTFWPFGQTEAVSVTSSEFWDSAYGLEIQRQLREGLQDISNDLKCVQPRAFIVRVDGQDVMVNIGSRQGIKVGDAFSIQQTRRLRGADGHLYLSHPRSSTQLVAQEVYPDHSLLTTRQGFLPGNLQDQDLVQLDNSKESAP